jgi:hypothetical protein
MAVCGIFSYRQSKIDFLTMVPWLPYRDGAEHIRDGSRPIAG